MAKKALHGVLQRVRMLAAVQTGRAHSDTDLLRRFIEHNDEAAFTVLVDRHGPMVLGVCRRALRHSQDAEDACQATFLVLARKAGSLRKTESLGSWLHGIACRVCANLRRQQSRRQKRERQASAKTVPDGPTTDWQEVQAVLDEELHNLPIRYRAPLLLCYWEGKTRDEAAEVLRLSAGKLHGLLERGRSLLRTRLTGRGLTLSSALCASFLAANVSKAALPPSLAVSCTRGAQLVASGQSLAAGTIPDQVLNLSKEVLRNMFVTKLKVATFLILCAGLLTALIGGSLSSQGLAQDKGLKIRIAQPASPKDMGESDEAFIRRLSKDLRGKEPTPTEIHFFVHSNDAGKRQKLTDLFIAERQARKTAAKKEDATLRFHFDMGNQPMIIVQDKKARLAAPEKKGKPAVIELKDLHFDGGVIILESPPSVISLQGKFLKAVAAARDKKEVAQVAHNYLDALSSYVKHHAKAKDVPDAMLQLEMVYRSLGKNVEANAWGQKLTKEFPRSAAAQNRHGALEGRFLMHIELAPEKKKSDKK